MCYMNAEIVTYSVSHVHKRVNLAYSAHEVFYVHRRGAERRSMLPAWKEPTRDSSYPSRSAQIEILIENIQR